VVCARPGPTSKADCLNNILDAILQFERSARFTFSGFILHDAEDVISPLELRLFNYLVDRKDLIQIPVYPFERKWTHFTSLSYLDEFSELHGKDVPVREALAGQVPSAGVGTCFSRRAVLALLADGDGIAFDVQSLTEDYDIGFRLRQKGMEEIFCRFPVVDKSDTSAKPFGQRTRTANVICVREYFPDTFATAVRQKSRWIIGIVFQGFKTHRWSPSPILNYFLWRDRKGAIANFLSFAAMLVMLQLVAIMIYQHFVDGAWQFLSIFVGGSWLTLLLWVNLLLMTNRILQRMIFVTGYYGLAQGLLVIPRLFWGNLINFMANWRAIKQVIQHGDPRRVAWDKTTHDFPTVSNQRSAQPLGYILVDSGVMTQGQLEDALQNRIPGLKLGGSLVKLGYITAQQLAVALAKQAEVPMESISPLELDEKLIRSVPAKVAQHHAVLPLRLEGETLVLACENSIDPVSLSALGRKVGRNVRYVIVPRGQVVIGLRHWYSNGQPAKEKQLLENAVRDHLLTREQADEVWETYVSGQLLFAEVLSNESYLNEAVLRAVLLRYERSDLMFGEFLVQEGVVSQHIVNHALNRQQNLQPSLATLLQNTGISRLQQARLVGEAS
jgi:adsorption protein B